MKTDMESTEKRDIGVQKREVTGPKKEISVIKKDGIDQKEQKRDKNAIKGGNKDIISVIKNFIGKEITVVMRNGDKLKGRLETVAQYELVITMAYNPVIVMKHAIDYITLTGEK